MTVLEGIQKRTGFLDKKEVESLCLRAKLLLGIGLICTSLLVGCTGTRLTVSSSSPGDGSGKGQNSHWLQPSDVANEVDRLKNWKGDFDEHRRTGYYRQTPLSNLLSMAKLGQPEGIVGIQRLIPYLANTSPTKSTRIDGMKQTGNTNRRAVRVNEYIADIIVRAADHQFYLASGDDIVMHLGDTSLKDPVIIKWFQNQIEHWCLINANRSLEKRKIADLNDGFVWNRMDAYDLLGRSKAPDGRQPLERRVNFLLNDAPINSMTRSEVANCAKALAEIGDKQSLSAVQRACDYIWNYPECSFFKDNDLFEAHHALSTLGEKQSAIAALKQYSDKHLIHMDAYEKSEFQKKLQESQSW